MIDESLIIDQIYTLVNQIDDIQVVHKLIPETTEYPCVIISPVSWNDEHIDLRDTLYTMTFKISIYVNLKDNFANGQTLIRTLSKRVRETLSKQENIKLNNTIDYSKVTSGQYSFESKESPIVRCDIDYVVNKRFNRYA